MHLVWPDTMWGGKPRHSSHVCPLIGFEGIRPLTALPSPNGAHGAQLPPSLNIICLAEKNNYDWDIYWDQKMYFAEFRPTKIQLDCYQETILGHMWQIRGT